MPVILQCDAPGCACQLAGAQITVDGRLLVERWWILRTNSGVRVACCSEHVTMIDAVSPQSKD